MLTAEITSEQPETGTLIFAWGDGACPELDRFSELATPNAEFPDSVNGRKEWLTWWAQADAPWGCLYEVPQDRRGIEDDLVITLDAAPAVAGYEVL